MPKRVMPLFLLIAILAFAACAAKQKNILETNEPQVKLRSMQSRVFDITDHNQLLRIIIATFQDLGFVIDDAEESLGTVVRYFSVLAIFIACLGLLGLSSFSTETRKKEKKLSRKCYQDGGQVFNV